MPKELFKIKLMSHLFFFSVGGNIASVLILFDHKIFLKGTLHGIMANVMICNTLVCLDSNHAIIFTLDLIPLGKIWTPLSLLAIR